MGKDPNRYLPASTTGIYQAFTENPIGFNKGKIISLVTQNRLTL